MIKQCVVLASVLALSGCISPGPLGESEFIEQVLPVDHDTALMNLREGWQVCSDVYGYPSYIQFKDHTLIDVFIVSPHFKDKTDHPLGRIELYPEGDRVRMRSGIHRNYITGQRRQNWLRWAVGDFVCDF